MLNEWAKKWGISSEAIADYKRMVSIEGPPLKSSDDKSEEAIKSETRLLASQHGIKLMRNNSGAFYDRDGRLIRFGLANESKRINEKFKSSDLIGITPILIRPQHIGYTMGVFTAYETKKYIWKWRGTKAEQAQLNFINYVISQGGIAKFITCANQIYLG